jgi:hypothetical protein
MTTASMASPSNKRRFNNDEGTSSTPPSALLRWRVGDEVGAEVPPVAEMAVLPSGLEKVVSVPQDDSCSDDGEGSSSDVDGGEGSNNEDGKDKAMHVPFWMIPSGIIWYKCPICLGELKTFRSWLIGMLKNKKFLPPIQRAVSDLSPFQQATKCYFVNFQNRPV